MNMFRITYIDYDVDGNEYVEFYDVESACNSIGVFMKYHSWAIDFIEKDYRILSVALV